MAKQSVYESTTKPSQRIAIWVIAAVMAIGTLTTFLVVIIANNNPDANPQQIAQNKQMEEYTKQMEEYQKQQAEYMATLRVLDGFEVSPFDADSVTELSVKTLKESDGEEVQAGATISANYTGWMPDGSIFDSTKIEGSDTEPREFPLDGVIEGWSIGLVGTRAGGIYELTIPAVQAYGEMGSNSIPPNTPLRFIVEIVAIVTE